MKLSIARGTTSKILHVKLFDERSIKGDGLTGLLYNSAGLSAYYMRPGDTATTQIPLVTCTLGTYASGGFREVSATNMPGVYEIHIPNAALASGAASCFVQIKGAANLVQREIEIELTAVDNQVTDFGIVLSVAQKNAIALATLIYDTSTVVGEPNHCLLNLGRSLRYWDVDVNGVLRVRKENGSAVAWQGQATASSGSPVTGVGP